MKLKKVVLFPLSLIVGIIIIADTIIRYGIEELAFLDTRAALKYVEENLGFDKWAYYCISILLWILIIKLMF